MYIGVYNYHVLATTHLAQWQGHYNNMPLPLRQVRPVGTRPVDACVDGGLIIIIIIIIIIVIIIVIIIIGIIIIIIIIIIIMIMPTRLPPRTNRDLDHTHT